MNIIYTLHALERIRQRGISRKLVELCLQNPDRDEELVETNRCVKKINDRVIVVIYKKEDENFIIITAYLSSKLRKCIK